MLGMLTQHKQMHCLYVCFILKGCVFDSLVLLSAVSGSSTGRQGLILSRPWGVVYGVWGVAVPVLLWFGSGVGRPGFFVSA